MTLITGLVDAYSYLVPGHVFVANVTGNIPFLGFALAGVRGLSVAASLAAVLVLHAQIFDPLVIALVVVVLVGVTSAVLGSSSAKWTET